MRIKKINTFAQDFCGNIYKWLMAKCKAKSKLPVFVETLVPALVPAIGTFSELVLEFRLFSCLLGICGRDTRVLARDPSRCLPYLAWRTANSPANFITFAAFAMATRSLKRRMLYNPGGMSRRRCLYIIAAE